MSENGAADWLFHVEDLDEAARRASGGPEGMGVCLACLHARADRFIEAHVGHATDEESVASIHERMIAKGGDRPRADAERLAIRASIGSAFTLGMHIGLELAAIREEKKS